MLLEITYQSAKLTDLLHELFITINERPFIALLIALTVAFVMTAWGTFRKPPRMSNTPLAQPRLLLTEFTVDETNMRVKIRGRLPGIFAFFAKFAGVNTETSMLATVTRVEFRTSNLSGEVSQVTPCQSVAMIECGFSRPFSALMIAIIAGALAVGFFSYGQTGMGLIGLSACLGMLFLYMLAKRFFIAVQSAHNDAYVLEFRRSLIDKTLIDIEQARRAMALLSKIIELNRGTLNDAMLEAREESDREMIDAAIAEHDAKKQG